MSGTKAGKGKIRLRKAYDDLFKRFEFLSRKHTDLLQRHTRAMITIVKLREQASKPAETVDKESFLMLNRAFNKADDRIQVLERQVAEYEFRLGISRPAPSEPGSRVRSVKPQDRPWMGPEESDYVKPISNFPEEHDPC